MDTLTLTRQPSLLEPSSVVGHDRWFAATERVELDRGAWVDVQRGWVDGHDELFDRVLEAADWQVWQRPMFDRIVDQPRLSTTWRLGDLPRSLDPIRAMAASLSSRYRTALTRVSANLYRDGNDSVAWHGDTHLRDLPQALVAVASLGHPRTFRLRPRGGGPSLGWQFGHGDLAVMGGTCQRTWQHAVPKVVDAGPRICIMFREAAAVHD